MAFDSLPPELKLNIIDRLDPLPTLHLALINKEYSRLCKDRLKEHAMFTKYSTIQPGYDGTFVWDFTKEILQDPRKGWYVRELNLIADRPDVNENMSEEDKTLFRVAVEKLLPLYPKDIGFFAAEDSTLRELGNALHDSITRGFEDAIIVILIHHLPQLRTLRLATNQGGDCMMIFMRRVAAGYHDPASARKMPLQYLNTVGIAYGDTDLSCSVDWAIYFMCVPSVRTLAASMMASEDVGGTSGDEDNEEDAGSEAHLRIAAGIPVSNVEALLLYKSRFDSLSFNTILPMIKNLRRLCYYAAGDHDSYQDYEARTVIKALSTHAGHSLEELQLAECPGHFEDSEDDSLFVPVRDFKKLKALHCETRWLLRLPNSDMGDDEPLSQGFHDPEEEDEEFKDPRDNLPESLEYLYLDNTYDRDNWSELVDMFRNPNANTPKLTLDNTCLSNRGETTFGNAVEPDVKFGTQQKEALWKGLELLY